MVDLCMWKNTEKVQFSARCLWHTSEIIELREITEKRVNFITYKTI